MAKTLVVYDYAPLDASDRCDARCGARSMVAILMRSTGLRLDFCGHDFNKHWPALKPHADIVLDDRG